jgi:hypothetical protein
MNVLNTNSNIQNNQQDLINNQSHLHINPYTNNQNSESNINMMSDSQQQSIPTVVPRSSYFGNQLLTTAVTSANGMKQRQDVEKLDENEGLNNKISKRQKTSNIKMANEDQSPTSSSPSAATPTTMPIISNTTPPILSPTNTTASSSSYSIYSNATPNMIDYNQNNSSNSQISNNINNPTPYHPSNPSHLTNNYNHLYHHNHHHLNQSSSVSSSPISQSSPNSTSSSSSSTSAVLSNHMNHQLSNANNNPSSCQFGKYTYLAPVSQTGIANSNGLSSVNSVLFNSENMYYTDHQSSLNDLSQHHLNHYQHHHHHNNSLLGRNFSSSVAHANSKLVKKDPILEYDEELAESIEFELGLKKQNGPRKNAWGNLSYAELITRAIESSVDQRLTLSQIYDWIVRYVPYFKEKFDRTSSAGWKNSIRHNLSLHNRFIRVQNESSGKSSWWMINPDVNKYCLTSIDSPSKPSDFLSDEQHSFSHDNTVTNHLALNDTSSNKVDGLLESDALNGNSSIKPPLKSKSKSNKPFSRQSSNSQIINDNKFKNRTNNTSNGLLNLNKSNNKSLKLNGNLTCKKTPSKNKPSKLSSKKMDENGSSSGTKSNTNTELSNDITHATNLLYHVSSNFNNKLENGSENVSSTTLISPSSSLLNGNNNTNSILRAALQKSANTSTTSTTLTSSSSSLGDANAPFNQGVNINSRQYFGSYNNPTTQLSTGSSSSSSNYLTYSPEHVSMASAYNQFNQYFSNDSQANYQQNSNLVNQLNTYNLHQRGQLSAYDSSVLSKVDSQFNYNQSKSENHNPLLTYQHSTRNKNLKDSIMNSTTSSPSSSSTTSSCSSYYDFNRNITNNYSSSQQNNNFISNGTTYDELHVFQDAFLTNNQLPSQQPHHFPHNHHHQQQHQEQQQQLKSHQQNYLYNTNNTPNYSLLF